MQADTQFGAWARIFVPGALFVACERGCFDPGKASPVHEISHVRAPVVLIHSRQDGFTPYDESQKIYAHSDTARTRIVIPSWPAPHAETSRQRPAADTTIVDGFLQEFKLPFGVRRGA